MFKKNLSVHDKIKRWSYWSKVRFISFHLLGVLGGASWVVSYNIGSNMYGAITNQVFVQSVKVETVQASDEKIDPLLDIIFMKESSRGVKNYSKCQAIGKYNRYGYNIPGDGTFECFEKGDDTKAVRDWLERKRLEGFNDNQLLCLYNTGKATDKCKYLE